MNKLAEIPANVLESIVRSQVYHMLTLGFSYPSQEMFAIYQDGSFMAELLRLLSILPHQARLAIEEASLADKVRLDLWGVGYRLFEVEYALTFEMGNPRPPCSLYQGHYLNWRPRSELLAELSGVYGRFGIAMQQGEDEQEYPDYLCAELEFLHFLALNEAQARDNGDRESVKRYRVGQKDFLERHLLPWLPELTAKIQGFTDLLFYPQLARLARRVVETEYLMVRRLV